MRRVRGLGTPNIPDPLHRVPRRRNRIEATRPLPDDRRHPRKPTVESPAGTRSWTKTRLGSCRLLALELAQACEQLAPRTGPFLPERLHDGVGDGRRDPGPPPGRSTKPPEVANALADLPPLTFGWEAVSRWPLTPTHGHELTFVQPADLDAEGNHRHRLG